MDSPNSAATTFAENRQRLIGMAVTRFWRGHGSAIFLDLGELMPDGNYLDGSPRQIGEYLIGIEGSWRIEGPRSILSGSWADDSDWEPFFDQIRGQTIRQVRLFGRLPEIAIEFANGLYLLSFNTSSGQPEWSLHCQQFRRQNVICVKEGELVFENQT